MPRSRSIIPAYGLHRPTGQARVRINGKDHYLGPHGSEESKREYERLIRKLVTDRAAEEVRARVELATDLTVSELILGFLRHAKAYYVKDGRQTTPTILCWAYMNRASSPILSVLPRFTPLA